MKDVIIKEQDVLKIAKEALPEILKETFSRSYSNPLRDALDGVLKSDELRAELKTLIMDTYKEVSKKMDFKVFVKEAVVRSVIDQLQK